MRQIKYFMCFLAGALIPNAVLLAQTCSHAAGEWIDWYGYGLHVWDLDQNPVRQITGVEIVNPVSGCSENEWPVQGTFLGNGQFTIRTTNPDPDDPICVQWIQHTGSITQPGCHRGQGTWTNSAGISYPFYWDKDCEIPNSETTQTYLWETNAPWRTAHTFRATISGGTGPDFGGRSITEWTASPGQDTCDIPGDSYDPETTIPNGTGGVIGENRYYDTIGWREDIVAYYRSAGRAPCRFTKYQEVRIDCVSGNTAFSTNTLFAEITPILVTNSRDGVSISRMWP